MKRFGENEVAVTPIIGTVVIVGLTVVMFVAVAAISVFSFTPPESVPQAKIVVENVKGGLRYDTPSVNFNENWIILYHEWGESMNTSGTKIQIRGYGETQDNTFGEIGTLVKGNILVEYVNLGYSGKLESRPNQDSGRYSPEYHGYEFHNPDLSDGSWSAGDKLTLNGQDSKNSGNSSTVKVYMDGVTKTSNNWRFSKGGQITITVMDIATNKAILVFQATVK